jgi:two-component system response regulator YesN
MGYKVLLVDDEKIVRDGISGLVEWEKHGIDFIGAAKDGFEAYDTICSQLPDIVITDIKMPVMNGLQLIEKTKAAFPEIAFVVLSGFGEYEYTSTAMLYGVKHYLLKPCDENKVISVLEDVKKELERKREGEKQFHNLKRDLEKVLLYSKEQFFREFALTGVCSSQNSEYYKSLYGIPGEAFQLLALRIDRECSFIEKFALKNIAEEILGEDRIYLSTILEEDIVFFIPSSKEEEIKEAVEVIKKGYYKYYSMHFTAALSKEDAFAHIHKMYMELQDLLLHRHYFENCILLTDHARFEKKEGNAAEYAKILEEIARGMKKGRIEEWNLSLSIFFSRLEANKQTQYEVQRYCKKLLELVANTLQIENADPFSKILKGYEHSGDYPKLQNEIISAVNHFARRNNPELPKNQNLLADEMIRSIHENIGNPELSLTWLAKEVFFMNEEYLGRVFSKKADIKFSQYVFQVRMEMAKELIRRANELKVYEISKIVGFEDSQYFSKLFKKYTGFKPSEYKQSLGRNIP